MQGVFISTTITGWDALSELVTSHVALVQIEQHNPAANGGFGGRRYFVKLMTDAQKKKYLQQERLINSIMDGFPLEWPQQESILTLETLKSEIQDKTSAISREWLVDRFNCRIRPKTKKKLSQYVKDRPGGVYLEATSIFGNEYQGPLTEAPRQGEFTIVGPDPAKKRSWFASIYWSPNKGWRVK